MCIEGRQGGRGREQESMCKGHFVRRIIELTQNTVFKGQGFEGLAGFAFKKDN